MRLNKYFDDIRSIKTFGDSMFPLLQDGDVVELRKADFKNLKTNDIICFRQKNHLVTHRIIYKADLYVIAKGDNNPVSDGKITAERILGKVYAVKRGSQTFTVDDLYLFQSSIYFEEIKRIVMILNKERIDFVILKGLPLHLFLEKKHPRRIYADCDILIAKKDIIKAKKILKEEGYRSLDFSLSKEHKKLKDKVVEESYGKEINGLSVIFDIHYEAAFMMTQLGSLDYLYPQNLLNDFTRSLLNNKRIVDTEGSKFPLLSLEDQIIYLFLHLFHHNFRGAYRYDILVKILDSKFDKYELVKIIAEYQLTNFVYAGLVLLQKYYPDKKYQEIIDLLDVSNIVKKYVKEKIIVTKIFNDEDRVGGGVKRFLLLFYLSPRPILIRFLTIFNKQVIYSIWWVIINKTRQTTLQKSPSMQRIIQKVSKKRMLDKK